MRGLLIYQPEDLRRNQWFAQELCKESAQYGLELLTVTAGQLLPAFVPDVVVNRSRDSAVSRRYEAMGVRCCNNAAVTEITNDKWLTHRFLQEHGLPVAQTRLCDRGTPPPDAYPVICKPVDGHGGTGVQLVRSAEEYHTAKASLPQRFLVQQPMVFGWDMRIYMLGGKVYAAMLRTSQTDFRSNFSLGGEAKPVSLTAELRQAAEQIAALLSADFVGIDLLRHPEGGYVIGEIEDAVGCRMLYRYTDLQPVRDLAAYLAGKTDALHGGT